MDTLALITATAAIVAIAWKFLARLPVNYWFVHPFIYNTFFILGITVLRGWAEEAGLLESYFFDRRHEVTTTLFTLAFYVLYAAVSWRMTFGPSGIHRAVPSAYTQGINGFATFLMYSMAVVLLLIFLYGAPRGMFHTLGESHGRLVSRFESILLLLFEGRWLLAGLAIAIYAATRRIDALVVVLGLCLVLMLHAAISGGRGHALMAVYLLAILATVHGLGLKKLVISAGVLAGIGFLLMVMTVARVDNQYRRAGSTDDVAANLGEAKAKLADRVEEVLANGIGRLTIYDAEFPVVVERVKEGADRPLRYRLGSAVDVLKFVPRVLWPGKPDDTFNVWMSRYLYGRYGLNQYDCPIGRVAESYYVAGWLGIVAGAFYGLAFTYVFLRLYAHSPSVSLKAIYIAILFGYIILGAANFANRLPIVIQVLVVFSPLLYALKKSEQAWPAQQPSLQWAGRPN